MRSRLPLVLSTTALIVAVLGSTPFGRAAVTAAVPLAKRAYLADTAKNAIRVNNIKASRTATPGMLLPLDASGKLPESVGAVGPKGDKGDKGDKGKKGDTGDSGATKVVVRFSTVGSGVSGNAQATAACASGETATGGGYDTFPATVAVLESAPSTSGGAGIPVGSTVTAWTVKARDLGIVGYTLTAYVLCASP